MVNLQFIHKLQHTGYPPKNLEEHLETLMCFLNKNQKLIVSTKYMKISLQVPRLNSRSSKIGEFHVFWDSLSNILFLCRPVQRLPECILLELSMHLLYCGGGGIGERGERGKGG